MRRVNRSRGTVEYFSLRVHTAYLVLPSQSLLRIGCDPCCNGFRTVYTALPRKTHGAGESEIIVERCKKFCLEYIVGLTLPRATLASIEILLVSRFSLSS
eukprot:IDg17857t1